MNPFKARTAPRVPVTSEDFTKKILNKDPFIFITKFLNEDPFKAITVPRHHLGDPTTRVKLKCEYKGCTDIFNGTIKQCLIMYDLHTGARHAKSPATILSWYACIQRSKGRISDDPEAAQPSREETSDDPEAVQPSTEIISDDPEAAQPSREETSDDPEAVQPSTEIISDDPEATQPLKN